MRVGFLSDIHGNIEALIPAYDALVNAKCDKIISVGDVVGYCARPNECIAFLRDREIPSVRGNHDHYVGHQSSTYNIQAYAIEAITWTRRILDPANMEWIRELPLMMEIDDELSCVHASMEYLDGIHWPYVLDLRSASFHFLKQEKRYCVCGHSHIPLLFSFHDETHQTKIEMLKTGISVSDQDFKYLFNPGAVGQPRDFDTRASVIVFDTESHMIELLRVSYDVEKAQKQIIDAKLPGILAERLARGR